MGVEIKMIKTKEMEMKYFDFGSGNQSFVIIPGIGITSITKMADAIVAMFEKFSKDFHVYVFDRRKDFPRDYDVFGMADDMAVALKQLGIKHACVYGTSQGGIIAQILAIKYPQLVGKLALASTTGRLRQESKEIIHRWVKIAQAMDLKNLAETFAQDIYTEDFVEKYGDLISAETLRATNEDLERFQILSRACDDWNATEELNKIQCSTLVLGATGDKIFKEEEFLELAEKIGCDVYIYEGYSHAVYDEASDFLERLYTFFMKE